jgi:hypothetical protein
MKIDSLIVKVWEHSKTPYDRPHRRAHDTSRYRARNLPSISLDRAPDTAFPRRSGMRRPLAVSLVVALVATAAVVPQAAAELLITVPSSIAVTCAPNGMAVGSTTTCTARLTSDLSPYSLQRGFMSFESDGTGTFNTNGVADAISDNTCKLLNDQCLVHYTPKSAGTHTITARFNGELVPREDYQIVLFLDFSSAHTSLTVGCSAPPAVAPSPTEHPQPVRLSTDLTARTS